MGPAVGAHRRELAPFGDLLADADPLLRPPHVLGVLARGEQLAEDLLDDDEVLDLAAGDGGQRLVEHAPCPPRPGRRAPGWRPRYDVVANVRSASPVSRPILHRRPEGLLLGLAIGGEHPFGRARPSRARCSRVVGQQGLRPRDPAARRPPSRRPSSRTGSPGSGPSGPRPRRRRAPVAGVRALELVDGAGVLEQHVRRRSQALQHLGRLRHALEQRPGALGITGAQGSAPLGDELVGLHLADHPPWRSSVG